MTTMGDIIIVDVKKEYRMNFTSVAAAAAVLMITNAQHVGNLEQKKIAHHGPRVSRIALVEYITQLEPATISKKLPLHDAMVEHTARSSVNNGPSNAKNASKNPQHISKKNHR